MPDMIEVCLLPMTREPEECEDWPLWEVKVTHAGEGPFALDVAARDAEHARAMLEHVSKSIAVIAVVPLAQCDGCDTCRTFGGCGSKGARELARGSNVVRWVAGLCERLGTRLACAKLRAQVAAHDAKLNAQTAELAAYLKTCAAGTVQGLAEELDAAYLDAAPAARG